MKVYIVTETLNEYGKKGALIGVTHSEKVAKEMAKGRGWYNSEANIQCAKIIETIEEFYHNKLEDKKRFYRDKFSEEQIQFIKENL